MNNKKRCLVVYFTESGNTRKIAEQIAAQTGSDLCEICTVTPYTKNYQALVDQAKEEIRKGYLPPIAQINYRPDDYDVIFLGSPNWWSTIAPPVTTFLGKYQTGCKIIAPFITHGGGGSGQADKDIRQLCPKAQVLDVLSIYGNGGASTAKEIERWLRKNGLTQ